MHPRGSDGPKPWPWWAWALLVVFGALLLVAAYTMERAAGGGRRGGTMSSERRALVQGEGSWWKPESHRKADDIRPGTISWEEHEEAWRAYASRYSGQSAEKIAERGGFGYFELVEYLGHPPKTWEPR